MHARGDRAAEQSAAQHGALELFIVSVVALYFEMIAIRWLASEVRVFAYLKNLPLVASFLGLGLGCALAGRAELFRLFPRLVVPFCALVAFARPLGLVHLELPVADGYRTWNTANWDSTLPAWLATARFLAVVFGMFGLLVGMFAALGDRLGTCMRATRPLRAYSINLVGSLIGIWLFAALAFLEWPPPAWFAIGFVLSSPLLLRVAGVRERVSGLACAGGALALMLLAPDGAIWSPYYRIELEPIVLSSEAGAGLTQAGLALSVNHDYHQKALDLSDAFIAEHPAQLLRVARFAYDLPYRLSQPASVLVVGAGTGNDVAAALRAGAARVDAVEIDPTILALGRRIHPEQPYADPRVTVINDDARSFFKRSGGRYDLIVFGLLDAHTVLSSFSSVRLDSYVYTEESLHEAVAQLAKGGAIAISFSTSGQDSDWLGWRLYRMLGNAISRQPVAVRTDYDLSTTFVAGPGVAERAAADPEIESRRLEPTAVAASVSPATDDWPFLYLRQRGLPLLPYGPILVGLFAISLVLLRAGLGRGWGAPDWHMLLLGAGFMLIEVRAISQLSLLFGSTWIVNSVVISAILAMALAANLFVALRRPTSPLAAYLLLAVALGLDFALPPDLLAGQPFAARALLGAVPAALPLAFAGVVFSIGFAGAADPARAMGWNLIGALVGGALEYLSMATGLSFLAMLALGLYALSLLALGGLARVGPRATRPSDGSRADCHEPLARTAVRET